MTQESPFGIKQSPTPARDENSIRFAALKPICVELLGSIAKNKGGSDTSSVFAILKRLNESLLLFVDSRPDRTPLSPSLINYVFFPLAQLLRSTAKGEADLPDRVRHVVFQILSSLASDWWQTWTDCLSPSSVVTVSRVKDQWKVWEQLLILGAVALGGPPDSRAAVRRASSEETQLAICSFLQEILLPRLATAQNKSAEAGQTWEWDGEEELPSLDDYDALEKIASEKFSATMPEETAQVYPSSAHLQHVFSSTACRGAIAHALNASLDLASINNVSATVRVACIKVSRTIISSWLADVYPEKENPTSLFKHISVERVFGGYHEEGEDDECMARTQADRVAVFLPGYVSSMVRILGLRSINDNSQVISQALLSLAVILKVCLGDAACAGLTLASSTHVDEGVGQAASLEDLMVHANIEEQTKKDANNVNSSEVNKVPPLNNGNSSSRSTEWLENTIAHVVIALHSIDPLASHSHSQVQLALINLAHTLLASCSSVLILQHSALLKREGDTDKSIDAIRLLLGWVVDIAASNFSMERAANSALNSLRQLFSFDSKKYRGAIIEEMLSVVQAMPTLLASQDDDDVEKKANRLRFLLCLSTSGFESSVEIFGGVKSLLQPSNGMDKWDTTLLWSIRVDEQASIGTEPADFTLQGLSSSASKAVMCIFEEIGRSLCRLIKADCATGVESNSPFALISSFMNHAIANRSMLVITSRRETYNHLLCQNALIVVDQMMRGVAEIFDDSVLALQTSKGGKKIRRVAHRFAKEVIGQVSNLWAEDEEELLQQDVTIRQESNLSAERRLLLSQEEGATAIERRSGIDHQQGSSFERPAGFGPALKLDFVTSATLPKSGSVQKKAKTALQLQTQAKGQLDRSDALLSSILASSAKVLGPSVKPLLLRTLYPIICGVASQSSTVRDAAVQTMDELARSAGYASVQGCVLDHADYVLGTASHRLVSTLGQELQAIAMRDKGDSIVHNPLLSAQSAPLVLVETIRMLGGEALTLVQDAIDEVLDAIDRYHLQDALCDDLLNVLSRLVEVMLEDERSKDSQGGKQKYPMVNSATIAFRPDVDRDMEELQKWWHQRQEKDGSKNKPSQSEMEAPDEEAQGQDEQNTSTSSQAVVVSMLEKAIPFLSHSSAVMRIRCLQLLNRGIELLCLQGRTVEPLQVINKAWPAIMSRLGFSPSQSLSPFEAGKLPAYEDLAERDFVACTEAAKLVTTLAKYLVDYLGPKKMIEQAVPRLLILLRIVERADGRIKQSKSSSQTTFLIKDDPTAKISTMKSMQDFKPLQRYTPLYTMIETVLSLLDTLVEAMGPHISEADLYRFAVHPILLTCLDKRQDDNLQKVAQHFYLSTLSRRNENLVWLVLSGAQDKDEAFPDFLHRSELDFQW